MDRTGRRGAAPGSHPDVAEMPAPGEEKVFRGVWGRDPHLAARASELAIRRWLVSAAGSASGQRPPLLAEQLSSLSVL